MNRLKTIRKKLHASQLDVANAIGISQQAYARYENEQREPKLATWKKLANYFGVSVGYLQGITDVKSDGLPINFESFSKISKAKKLKTTIDDYTEMVNNYNKKNNVSILSEMLIDLYNNKPLSDEIDNNLSSIEDRILVYNLLNGVISGIYTVLKNDIGLKNHRNELKDILEELKKINDQLIKMIDDDNNN